MDHRDGSDIKIMCRQCGKEFVFTKSEQVFYEQKGWSLPKRCKECRLSRREESRYIICFQCGNELDNTTTAYCGECYASNIASNQLEYELNKKKLEDELNTTKASLKAIEANRYELQKEITLKEHKIDELVKEVNNLNNELKEMSQLHAALNQWFQPSLNSLEKKMEESIGSLEQRQNTLSERLSQVAHRLQEIREGLQSISLFELIRRCLRKQNT